MKYLAKKLAALVATLLVVSLLAFLAFQVIPGDPTTKILGTEATDEAVEALRQELGLNENVFVRYLRWLGNFLTGDFGMNYSRHMPVSQLLGDGLVVTFSLTVLSFIITVLIAIPLGILAGSARSRALDGVFAVADQVVMSIPTFFMATLLTWVFGILLGLFRPGQYVSYMDSIPGFLACLIMPALSIAIPRIAMTVKMLRSAIQEEMEQDYVRTARSRGNNRRAILVRHVLKNAMVSTVTFLAVSAAEIMTGSIIIEQVFGLPGAGQLLLEGISNREYLTVQAIVVILAAWVVLVNFLADILHQLLDPRVRYE